jgi:hypothetical protein
VFVTIALCTEIPIIALLWAMVACGVRWRRTGRQPPRFMLRALRQQRRVLPQTFAAATATVNLLMAPQMPWNRDGWLYLRPMWVVFGTLAVAVLIPVGVVFHLTRPGAGRPPAR